MVVVLAARLDVQRDPGLHREALQRVREQRERETADAFPREGEVDLGVRAPDEVDRGCRPRLVHRHGRRAVARDAGAAVERLAERVAEPGEDVLDRVMLVHVEVAAGEELEVEAAVEAELREQVVEEADPGVGPDAPAAVEGEADAEGGLGGRLHDEGGAGGRGLGRRAEGREDAVVLGRLADRDPQAVPRRRTTSPCASSSSARSEPRTTTKFPADGGQSKPVASSASRMRSRSAIVSSTSSVGLRSAAAAIRADGAETGAGSRRRSSSRARAGGAIA